MNMMDIVEIKKLIYIYVFLLKTLRINQMEIHVITVGHSNEEI